MIKHSILLGQKYSALLGSTLISFNEIAAMKDIMGVYIIYSPEAEVLYVGSTNKFHIRFGVDLKHESTHTLMCKFLKGAIFPDRKVARSYLIDKCKFRIEVCRTKREAEALEHLAIWTLDPTYNK